MKTKSPTRLCWYHGPLSLNKYPLPNFVSKSPSSQGMDEYLHPIEDYELNYISMPSSELCSVSKGGSIAYIPEEGSLGDL